MVSLPPRHQYRVQTIPDRVCKAICVSVLDLECVEAVVMRTSRCHDARVLIVGATRLFDLASVTVERDVTPHLLPGRRRRTPTAVSPSLNTLTCLLITISDCIVPMSVRTSSKHSKSVPFKLYPCHNPECKLKWSKGKICVGCKYADSIELRLPLHR